MHTFRGTQKADGEYLIMRQLSVSKLRIACSQGIRTCNLLSAAELISLCLLGRQTASKGDCCVSLQSDGIPAIYEASWLAVVSNLFVGAHQIHPIHQESNANALPCSCTQHGLPAFSCPAAYFGVRPILVVISCINLLLFNQKWASSFGVWLGSQLTPAWQQA